MAVVCRWPRRQRRHLSVQHLGELRSTTATPARHASVTGRWRQWDCRLRPMLLPADARNAYRQIADGNKAQRLGQIARLGIGYVSGDNGFFHLRPSDAERLDLAAYLRPSVTSGRQLHDGAIDPATVDRWRSEDRATFLVHVGPNSMISDALADYLASDAATIAQSRYKCRVRSPWYAVPNVTTPDMFLAYMSTDSPALARNDAGCVCSNAVHAVRLHAKCRPRASARALGNILDQTQLRARRAPLGWRPPQARTARSRTGPSRTTRGIGQRGAMAREHQHNATLATPCLTTIAASG